MTTTKTESKESTTMAETRAIQKIVKTIESLELESRARVLAYVFSAYDKERQHT